MDSGQVWRVTDEITKVVNPCLSVCGPARSVQLRAQVLGQTALTESTFCLCHIVAMARNHKEGITTLPRKPRTKYEVLGTRSDATLARSTQ